MKLAFLDSVFPGLTSTFVNREFEYLRDCTDIDVTPFSVKRPGGWGQSNEQQFFAKETVYLNPDSRLKIVLYNLIAPLMHPIAYWRAFKVVGGDLANHRPPVAVRMIMHFLYGVYLGSLLRRTGFDGIHAHFSSASTVALVAHLFSKLPFSFTLHASDDLYVDPILLDAKLKCATCVITNNRYNEMHINLLTHYQYANKITVIYNGVDIGEFEAVSPRSGLTSPLKLLSVGSFTGCKGYATVLRALAKLKRNGTPFHYSIIGGGNPEEQRMIERLISEGNLAQEVKLLGRQSFSVVKEAMAASDALIMASEIGNQGVRDGLPNVIIEAMLSKRPVVATYVSDIPNLVRHGETGYLFPEKSSDALVDILQELCTSYENTHPIVEKAYTVARQRFDRHNNYPALVSCLKHLAPQPF